MTVTLVIPDTHVRGLRDGALINRLRTDVVHGLRRHHRTGLIAGFRIHLAQADPAEDDALAGQLERCDLSEATVARHDGWTDVELMPGYTVSLYAQGWFR